MDSNTPALKYDFQSCASRLETNGRRDCTRAGTYADSDVDVDASDGSRCRCRSYS
jgi:hypothetical protein